MPQEFLTTTQIKEILGVSMNTAQRLANQLPNVRIGKPGSRNPCIRVRKEIFYNWLAQQDGYGVVRKPLRAVKGGAGK